MATVTSFMCLQSAFPALWLMEIHTWAMHGMRIAAPVLTERAELDVTGIDRTEGLALSGTGSGTKPPETKPPQSKRRVVATDSRENLSLADAKSLLASLDQQMQTGQDIKLNISWIIEESGGAP